MSIAQYGVSEELAGVFTALRETSSSGPYDTGGSGEKYDPKSINTLSKMIVCRNYSNATYELSNLLLAVTLRQQAQGNLQGTQDAWLDFFWVEEYVTPRRFRQAFEELATPGLTMGEDGLTIQATATPFTMSPSRIGVLAALLEFLVYIQPSVLDQPDSFYLAPSEAEIKKLANLFQSTLYDYLKDHLNSAQQQSRFWFMQDWFESQGEKLVEPSQITDEGIFQFWQSMAPIEDDKLGFRLFRTAAENFFDLRTALGIVSSQQQVAQSSTIGYEDGVEMSPDTLEQALETADDALDVLSLSGNPKFMVGKQAAEAALVASNAGMLEALPLTVARYRSFGDWQAVLVQALRSKKPGEMAEKLALVPETYEDQLESWSKLTEKALAAKDSGLYLLLHNKSLEAFAKIITALDTPTRETLLEKLDLVLDDDETRMAGDLAMRFLERWKELQLEIPNFNQYIKTLKKAFGQNGRDGFTELRSDLETEPYLEGISIIESLVVLIERYSSALRKQLEKSSEEAKTVSDLSIFQSMFNTIYGGSYESR